MRLNESIQYKEQAFQVLERVREMSLQDSLTHITQNGATAGDILGELQQESPVKVEALVVAD